MDKKKIERREFLKKSAVTAAVGLTLPTGRVLGANDRVRLGIIGPGARGHELMKQALGLPNVEFGAAATSIRAAATKRRGSSRRRKSMPIIASF